MIPLYMQLANTCSKLIIEILEQDVKYVQCSVQKFWTFNRQEKATKIEQVPTREEFWSLGDNKIVECPPGKGVYCQENQKIHQKFQHLFKANLVLLANTPIPGQNMDSWPCPVSLHRGNTLAIMYK